MRRPPASPPPLATALAALLAAGCSSSDRLDCPGTDLGALRLAGTRAAAGCAAGGPAAGFDALYPATVALTGTLAFTPQGSGAAICPDRPRALPLVGTRGGSPGQEQVEVALDTSGAVLGACSSACEVAVHQAISGSVTRDPLSGAPTGFTGTLTETAAAAPRADCGPCTLPCSATWSLAWNP